jgi:elongator complex protein 3
VRGQQVDPNHLSLNDFEYQAAFAHEHFLSYLTSDELVAGYLRLSLGIEFPPAEAQPVHELYRLAPELIGAAIIREVHIYGQSLEVGNAQNGAAQHIGLGTGLIKKAEEISKKSGYKKIAVISAIGTREYYRKRGFTIENLYMTKNLS